MSENNEMSEKCINCINSEDCRVKPPLNKGCGGACYCPPTFGRCEICAYLETCSISDMGLLPDHVPCSDFLVTSEALE